jgi:uncharacterized protein
MFELHNADNGGFYWTLSAGNNEVLCHSEVYTTKASAHVGIAAAKRVAPTATTTDRT